MTPTNEDLLALAERADSWNRCWPGNLNLEKLVADLSAALRVIVAERQKPQAVKVKPRIFMLPDGRAGVCVGGRYDGWMMYRHPDGQWVTDHKMPVSDPSESLPAILAALDVSETPESDRQTDLLSASERQAIRDKALDDAAQAASNRAAFFRDAAETASEAGFHALRAFHAMRELCLVEIAAAIRAMKGKPE